jgi:U3 small nucleolar RNA-associated protein 14
VDLDEDEPERQSEKNSAQGTDDEEIDGASDEFLDVLDVLDGRGKPDFGDDEEDEEDDERKDEEEAEAEDGEDGDEEMGDAFVPSDTEQQIDGEALDHLGAFVSQLEPGKKRRAEDESQAAPGGGGDPPPRKRRMLKERTEAGVEGEFGVHAASGSS